jgi:NADPH-dependent ferric siderophore reductase
MGLMRSAHFTMAKLPRLCTSQARRAKAAAAAAARQVVWVAGEAAQLEINLANHLDAEIAVEVRELFKPDPNPNPNPNLSRSQPQPRRQPYP